MPEFVRLAMKKAQVEVDKKFRHCCIIFSGGRFLDYGVNSGTDHAEIAAMRNASNCWAEVITGSRFISIRVNKNGKLGNAKPCPACEKALRSLKMRGWYSTSEGELAPWK